MQITFLGATGTVTGSRYLLECADARLMIDCGLFQGYKQLRLKNWSAPPFDPRSIDAGTVTATSSRTASCGQRCTTAEDRT